MKKRDIAVIGSQSSKTFIIDLGSRVVLGTVETVESKLSYFVKSIKVGEPFVAEIIGDRAYMIDLLSVQRGEEVAVSELEMPPVPSIEVMGKKHAIVGGYAADNKLNIFKPEPSGRSDIQMQIDLRGGNLWTNATYVKTMDGRILALIASNNGFLYVIQLFGPVPKIR